MRRDPDFIDSVYSPAANRYEKRGPIGVLPDPSFNALPRPGAEVDTAKLVTQRRHPSTSLWSGGD